MQCLFFFLINLNQLIDINCSRVIVLLYFDQSMTAKADNTAKGRSFQRILDDNLLNNDDTGTPNASQIQTSQRRSGRRNYVEQNYENANQQNQTENGGKKDKIEWDEQPQTQNNSQSQNKNSKKINNSLSIQFSSKEAKNSLKKQQSTSPQIKKANDSGLWIADEDQDASNTRVRGNRTNNRQVEVKKQSSDRERPEAKANDNKQNKKDDNNDELNFTIQPKQIDMDDKKQINTSWVASQQEKVQPTSNVIRGNRDVPQQQNNSPDNPPVRGNRHDNRQSKNNNDYNSSSGYQRGGGNFRKKIQYQEGNSNREGGGFFNPYGRGGRGGRGGNDRDRDRGQNFNRSQRTEYDRGGFGGRRDGGRGDDGGYRNLNNYNDRNGGQRNERGNRDNGYERRDRGNRGEGNERGNRDFGYDRGNREDKNYRNDRVDQRERQPYQHVPRNYEKRGNFGRGQAETNNRRENRDNRPQDHNYYNYAVQNERKARIQYEQQKKSEPVKKQEPAPVVQPTQQLVVKKVEILPRGQKCWPELSMYVMQTRLSFSYRQITEHQCDMLIIPYKDTKFQVYPGNIINKCKADYRKKITDKGSQIQEIGYLYPQRCVGIDNFKAIGFLKMGRSGNQSDIRTCISGILPKLQQLKITVSSVLIPYSKQLGPAKQFIRMFVESLSKFEGFSQINISTNNAADFKAGIKAFTEEIECYMDENKICIDF